MFRILKIEIWNLFGIWFLEFRISLCAPAQRAGQSAVTLVTQHKGCVRYPT